jgi:5-methyltetrahydrofolate corrinoid/iron sulfur protein methyltransferase
MILAADNLHALNPVVARALDKLEAEPIRAIARQCEQAGARWIDLNPGYLSKKREDRMAFLVEVVQQATSMEILLDSPHPRILAKGLAACRTKPILNGLTLEPDKLREMLPLAVEHKTKIIALLLDENSFSPPRLEEKLAIALQLRDAAAAAGLAPGDLIFDPVLPNLSWQDAFQRFSETIKTLRLLTSGDLWGEPATTIVGLSNLRSGLKKHYPAELDVVSLGLLGGAGLQCVLADALHPEINKAWRLINQLS